MDDREPDAFGEHPSTQRWVVDLDRGEYIQCTSWYDKHSESWMAATNHFVAISGQIPFGSGATAGEAVLDLEAHIKQGWDHLHRPALHRAVQP